MWSCRIETSTSCSQMCRLKRIRAIPYKIVTDRLPARQIGFRSGTCIFKPSGRHGHDCAYLYLLWIHSDESLQSDKSSRGINKVWLLLKSNNHIIQRGKHLCQLSVCNWVYGTNVTLVDLCWMESYSLKGFFIGNWKLNKLSDRFCETWG